MVFRVLFFLLIAASHVAAQHNGFSYELQNEIGTYQLVSFTVTHKADNAEGVTYLISKHREETIYQIDEYLNGWVGLSQDGRTIAHLVSEKKGKALVQSELVFYRDGKRLEKAKLSKLIHYDLKDARLKNQLSKKGWLKNDSALHKMASNPFFVSDDKLYISFTEPKLSVFDMNRVFHIYTGNGANHFTQNYYSIPNAPYRTDYDWGEYLPKGFPNLSDEKPFEHLVSNVLGKTIAIPEMASLRASIEIKLLNTGAFEIRKAEVFDVMKNEKDEVLSKQLAKGLEKVQLSTILLPPLHTAWLFETNFWLK
ncbi:MAG: hypothetical protein ACI8VL_000453 [Bacteroidia bacterium]|jgi:hypothetical protein